MTTPQEQAVTEPATQPDPEIQETPGSENTPETNSEETDTPETNEENSEATE